MSLAELFKFSRNNNFIQGIENKLHQRRQAGLLSLWIGIAGAVYQSILLLLKDSPDLSGRLNTFISRLFTFQFSSLFGEQSLSFPEFTGFTLFLAGFALYFLLKKTNLLLEESKEPFRYTFWVSFFTGIANTPGGRFNLKNEDILNLLSFDLIERLNTRIKRLSILNEEDKTGSDSLNSHIQIYGNYVVREIRDGEWVLQVNPMIRIGSLKSSTLADPVKFPLLRSTGQDELNADRYNRIVERIYSSIATEIYRQIRIDLKEKLKLFPTDYLRAAALFYEANDFEKSNTIDAYDYAIELYKESKRYFDIRITNRIAATLIKIPFLWRFFRDSKITEAKTRTGYSRCLIYRRFVSTASGRNQNSLFETHTELSISRNILLCIYNRLFLSWKTIDKKSDLFQKSAVIQSDKNNFMATISYLTYKKDSPLKRQRPLFNQLTELLFETYTISSLAYSSLEANISAKEFLTKASAFSPLLSESNELWFLASAEIEPDLNQAILLLTKAVELQPNFQIAQFRLAKYKELKLRMKNEISLHRINSINKEYDEVLRINPGNIAALAAQGYLWWLVGDYPMAAKKFEEGTEIKAVARQTYTGDLIYGLARISAAKENYDESYDMFLQAISADPGTAAYSTTANPRATHSYYDYISPGMLNSFEKYYITIKEKIDKLLTEPQKKDSQVSEKVLRTVLSYVQNDYGNACLNFFHRFGSPDILNKAIDCFKESINNNSENFQAHFNLHNALFWKDESSIEAINHLAKAERVASFWSILLFSSAQAQVQYALNQIKLKKKKINDLQNAKSRLISQKNAAEFITKEEEEQYVQNKSEQSTLNNANSFRSYNIQAQTNIPDAKLEQKPAGNIKELKNRIAETQHEIETLERDVEDTRQNSINKAFQLLTKVLSRTKLMPLFNYYKIDTNGTGIDELLNSGIIKDRLEENDVLTLRLLTEILSYNEYSKSALDAAYKLSLFIKMFYPENFEANVILDRIVDQSKTDEKDNYLNEIRNTIRTWLLQHQLPFTTIEWAQSYLDKKELTEYLYKIIELEPGSDIFYSRLAETYYDLEDFNSAAAFFNKTIKLAPENDGYYNQLGNSYFALKDFDKAIENYNKASGLNNSNAVYYANAGLANKNLRQWDKAADYYKKALNIEPDNKEYQSELKLLYNEEGNEFYSSDNFQMAAQKYKQALEVDFNDAVIHSNLALASDKLNLHQEAEKEYLLSTELDPSDSRNWNYLGLFYYNHQQYEKSIQPYKNAIKNSPNNPVYYDNLGISFEYLNKTSEAEENYLKVAALEPDNAKNWNNLGLFYYNNKNYLKAVENYTKALSLEPDKAVFLSNLGLAYRQLGEWEKAAEFFNKALEINPNDANIWNNLGLLNYNKGSILEAIHNYKRAIELLPDSFIFYDNLGLAYEGLGDWVNAEKAYIKVIELKPEDSNAYNNLGILLNKQNENSRAAEVLKKAAELNPSALIYDNLASTYEKLGDLNKAEAAYKKSVELEPGNAVYLNNIGLFYFNKNSNELAIDYYKKAIQIDSKNSVFHINLGLAYKKLFRYKDAEISMLKAAELDSNNADIWNNLGILYYEQKQHDKAINNYLRAIELRPDVPTYYDNIGLAYSENENYPAALSVYLKALELSPENEVFLMELGRLYSLTGEKNKAAEIYLDAIRSKPDSEKYLAQFLEIIKILDDKKAARDYLFAAKTYIPDNKDIELTLKQM